MGVLRELGSVFLILIMLAIGLQVELRQMVSEVRKHRLVAKALLANLVVVPLLGIALAALFHLKGDVAAGFLLLALAPGAPFAMNFTTKAKGGAALAASLLFVLLLASVVFTPLLANLVLPEQSQVSLPYIRLIGQIILVLILPFAIGLALTQRAPEVSAKLCKITTLLAALVFVAFMVLSMSTGKEARSAVGGHTLLAMLVFIAVAMVAGWSAGGPERANRQVMAVGTSMRNVAVALLLAQSLGSETAQVVVVAFFSLMVPCNLLLTVYETVMLKRKGVQTQST